MIAIPWDAHQQHHRRSTSQEGLIFGTDACPCPTIPHDRPYGVLVFMVLIEVINNGARCRKGEGVAAACPRMTDHRRGSCFTKKKPVNLQRVVSELHS